MGNCQAIDVASLVIQHPSGKVEKLYSPILASKVMKLNPGHYVVLLLSTTLYPPPTSPNNTNNNNNNNNISELSSFSSTSKNNSCPIRLTKIKLLKPMDTLTLGHAYRLIPTQEVMKGLKARKLAKVKKCREEAAEKPEKLKEKENFAEDNAVARRPKLDKLNQVVRSEMNQPPPTTTAATTTTTFSNHSTTARSRTWQPSLHSILEAGS